MDKYEFTFDNISPCLHFRKRTIDKSLSPQLYGLFAVRRDEHAHNRVLVIILITDNGYLSHKSLVLKLLTSNLVRIRLWSREDMDPQSESKLIPSEVLSNASAYYKVNYRFSSLAHLDRHPSESKLKR